MSVFHMKLLLLCHSGEKRFIKRKPGVGDKLIKVGDTDLQKVGDNN